MKVLIYLPVFNDETRIERAIKSIVMQTFTDWQLIISDNKSKDNTYSLIQPYLIDERIRSVSLKTHVTGGENVNNIENFISSEDDFDLVCLIASDDYWGDENYLSNLVSIFLENTRSTRVKLAIPIFNKISNMNSNTPTKLTIKIENKLYLFRVFKLFRNWGVAHLLYGLYDKSFFIEILTDKFSRLNKSNYSDWWWAYFVLKKTSPVLCFRSEYFKDDYKFNAPDRISRIHNIKLTFSFVPNLFRGKFSKISLRNSQDFFIIFFFAISKTFFDLLRTVGRVLKRVLKV